MIKAGDTERVLKRRQVAATGIASADAEELKLKLTNQNLLQQIAAGTSGIFEPTTRDLLTPAGRLVTTWQPVATRLFALAIFLLLGEVLVRRRWMHQ
jgi:hypothetical protein